MPYLLPDDPAVSELDCVLVYFPNAEEYRQALFGQIAELSDVWNWEGSREDQALARAAWLAAELETLKNMGCFDEVVALLQEIRDKECCEDDFFYEIVNDPVDDGGGTLVWPAPGPPPLPLPDNDTGDTAEDYPITPVTDPDEGGTVVRQDWLDYACGAADWIFESWIDWLYYTRFLIVTGNTIVRAISWLTARIAARILPGVLDDFAVWEMPTLTEVISTHMQNLTVSEIDDAILQLDTVRDALKCALVGQATAAQAIAALLAILDASINNATVYAILASPIAAMVSLVWNGLLDVAWSEECDCVVLVDVAYWPFTSSAEGWRRWTGATVGTDVGAVEWAETRGNPPGSIRTNVIGTYYTSPAIPLVECDRIQLTMQASRGSSGAQRCVAPRIVDASGNVLCTFNNVCSSFSSFSGSTQVRDVVHAGGNVYLQLQKIGSTTDLWVDNVTVTAIQTGA